MARVLIATVTEGGIHEVTAQTIEYITSISNAASVKVKGRPTDYARNSTVRLFLGDKQFTHLFFVDSDIGLPLDVLDRLLALDAPLASGCYPLLMRDGLRWAIANKDNSGRYRLLKELKNEPFEADAGGAGCLLIRRDVFDKVTWPWFKWIENEDGSQVSEDIFFFKKCNAAGLKVKVDPAVICNHFKIVNLTELMKLRKKGRTQNVD